MLMASEYRHPLGAIGTCGVHDGHAAVAHGVQLVEAARLKAAGHEPDVGRRCQFVREVLIVALRSHELFSLILLRRFLPRPL